MNKTAFITGITGQDGAWLSKKLLEEGYTVIGGMRRTSNNNLWRLDYLGIKNKINIVEFDLLDYSNIYDLIKSYHPDEFYNLAAQSFVGVSFKQPLSTSMIDGMSVAYILDILKTISPETKFYQASTSEMFGLVQEIPQKETTSFYPRSPYGCAKVFAHWMTVNYRESYNMFCCCGILFNHESELRGEEFVTRKITRNVAQKHLGKKEVLELGSLDARRDWSHAQDFVNGMFLIMQHDKPDTYVLASGRMSSVREFVEIAFREINTAIYWEGSGVEEIGRDEKGETLVRVNPQFYRPAEVEQLCGDSTKARQILSWQPKYNLQDLVKVMVASDIKLLK